MAAINPAKRRIGSWPPALPRASQSCGWVACVFNGAFRGGQYARCRSTPLNFCPALPRWPLLYLTVRDQMLSPILQGAVFGIGGLALGHVRTFLQARRQTRADAR